MVVKKPVPLVHSLPLPLTSWVILDELLNFSVPQFLHLWTRDDSDGDKDTVYLVLLERLSKLVPVPSSE